MTSELPEGSWRVEYGVFVDKRLHGLGVALVRSHADLERAESDADVLRRVEPYPVAVKQRGVFRTAWEDIADA